MRLSVVASVEAARRDRRNGAQDIEACEKAGLKGVILAGHGRLAAAAVQISPAAILIVRARTALLKKNASTQ
jgi:hypothetical protein